MHNLMAQHVAHITIEFAYTQIEHNDKFKEVANTLNALAHRLLNPPEPTTQPPLPPPSSFKH